MTDMDLNTDVNTDLNIDNYNLDDILDLFKLDINYGYEELKKAKKIVLLTHPDKSGLSSDVFLFFSKAYKTLYYIYNLKEKNRTIDNVNNLAYDGSQFIDETNDHLIEKFRSSTEFNKLFNKLFDEHKLNDDYAEHGYGDWLKKDSEPIDNVKTFSEMNEVFNREREKKRELIKYEGVKKVNDTNSFYEIDRNTPKEYSSGIFSGLQFEDLRKAHEENIIPVTDADKRTDFKNVSELLQFRTLEDSTINIRRDHQTNYMNNLNDIDRKETTRRNYKLVKQMEESNKINKSILAKFNYLTY